MHSEQQKISYVLGICERVEREFTLREVVARILDERPEMILEFADVWGKLFKDKLIGVCRGGAPNTYELTTRKPRPTMQIEEAALRDMLQSADASTHAHALLDAVAGRTVVTIQMTDGSVLRLVDVSDSLNTLREKFGWNAAG
jgi:hypothetical protein